MTPQKLRVVDVDQPEGETMQTIIITSDGLATIAPRVTLNTIDRFNPAGRVSLHKWTPRATIAGAV